MRRKRKPTALPENSGLYDCEEIIILRSSRKNPASMASKQWVESSNLSRDTFKLKAVLHYPIIVTHRIHGFAGFALHIQRSAKLHAPGGYLCSFTKPINTSFWTQAPSLRR